MDTIMTIENNMLLKSEPKLDIRKNKKYKEKKCKNRSVYINLLTKY